jgi:hypothetical protein
VPPTFCEPALEARFREVGYVVVDLLTPQTTADLGRVCEKHHDAPTTTWNSDFFSDSPAVKAEVSEAIEGAFVPPLDQLLCGHKPLLTNFVVNWPGPDGGLPLHHHSSVIDERYHRSVVVWCALGDAVEDNGTLHVVERSHRVPLGPWSEGRPDWFADRSDDLLDRHLTSVSVQAGQALIFDNALLHCSFPNVTEAPRRTAVAVVTPNGVPLRYYQWDQGSTHAYALDADFFVGAASQGLQWADPDGLEHLGAEPGEGTIRPDEEIDRLLQPGDCSHLPSAVAGTSHP